MCWKQKSLDSTFTCCVSNIGCQLVWRTVPIHVIAGSRPFKPVLVKAQCARNNTYRIPGAWTRRDPIVGIAFGLFYPDLETTGLRIGAAASIEGFVPWLRWYEALISLVSRSVSHEERRQYPREAQINQTVVAPSSMPTASPR